MKHECNQLCAIRNSIELLASVAFQKSLKYRFDPALGPTHSAYLEALKSILQTIKEEQNVL